MAVPEIFPFTVRSPAARLKVWDTPKATGTFSVCALAELLVKPPVRMSVLPVALPMEKLPAVLLKVRPVSV